MKNRFISLFLAINILTSGVILTACSKNKNDQKIGKSISIETELPTESVTEETLNKYLDAEFLNEIKEKIDSVNIEYLNSDYYPNEETIKEYKEMANKKIECPEESSISYPDIISKIRDNTIEKYGDSNGAFYPKYSTSTDLEKEIYNNFEYAISESLKHIFSKKNNNYQEDLCSIKSISIVNGSLSGEEEESDINALGLFDKDSNTVYIDYEKIVETYKKINSYRIEQEKDEITFKKYLTDILEHELNHVRQYPCSHRIKNGDKGEETVFFDNDHTSFIIESSAESGIYNYNNSYEKLENSYYTYTLYRESEALLMLLAAFKDNKDLNGYYEAIYDCDEKKFWDYFELDNDEKLKNFHKIFYAFNTIHGRTELSKKAYGNKNKAARKELEELVGDSYLIDMMKFIVKDLITATERDNLSIDDSLLLYMISKSYISDEAKTIIKDEDGSYHNEYSEDFIKSYKEIEDYYKEYLIYKFDISLEELNDIFISNKVKNDLYDFDNYVKKDYSNISSSMYERSLSLKEKYPVLTSILNTKLLLIYNTNDFDEYLNSIDSDKVMTK